MLILIMHFIGRRLFLWWIIQQVDEKEVKIKGVELKAKYGEYNFKREATKKTDTLKKVEDQGILQLLEKQEKQATRRGARKQKIAKNRKIEK